MCVLLIGSTNAVAGPKSRELLAKLFPSIDLSNEGLPFMGLVDTKLGDIPARIYRISFSGELAFEVNVESNYGLHLWKKIMETGSEFGVQPYGTEALSTLRIEMGHVAGPAYFHFETCPLIQPHPNHAPAKARC